jgi:hypothetical protein
MESYKKSHKYLEEKRRAESTKEQLSLEILTEVSYLEKLELIEMIKKEILQDFDFTYRKINDLIMLCKDSNLNVVTSAIKSLVIVFPDVLPMNRIRLIDD